MEENKLNIFHLSDTHFTKAIPDAPGGFDAPSVVDDGTRLRRVLQTSLSYAQKPDLFLITGDLVHEGDAEDYKRYRALLDECCEGIPYYVCLGNHDRHQAFYEGFLGESERTGPYFYSTMQDGLRIIALDSSPVDATILGKVTREQLDFLKKELSCPAPKGTIVILHHPPRGVIYESFSAHCPEMEELAALLESGEVRGVFSGHTHFVSCSGKHGVLYSTASSTAFSMEMREADRGMVFSNRSTFNLIRIDEENLFVGTEDMDDKKVLLRISAEKMEQLIKQEIG